MKALELANLIDERKHAQLDFLYPRAAAELRRLAEVNAELVRQMERYLPVLARAEDSAAWGYLTSGTGIATATRYRAAIAKAKEQQ